MFGNKRKSSCLLLGIIIIIALTSGAYYYSHNVNGNIKTTLYAVLEYPNEELFVDIPTYIPLNETQIDFEEKEIDEAVSEEYNRWKNKLEKCFSEDCFDSFYNQWERSMCNGLVYSDNYSSQITNIKLSQRIKDVQYLVVDLDVKNASGIVISRFSLKWKAILSNTDYRIQKMQIIDDDGWSTFLKRLTTNKPSFTQQ